MELEAAEPELKALEGLQPEPAPLVSVRELGMAAPSTLMLYLAAAWQHEYRVPADLAWGTRASLAQLAWELALEVAALPQLAPEVEILPELVELMQLVAEW